MSLFKIAISNFRYYWKSQLSLLLAWVLTCTILVGALNLGDSVKNSLQIISENSLGQVHFGLNLEGRTLRASLAQELEKKLNTPVIPLIHRRGSVKTPDGLANANQVHIWGVEDSFWQAGQSSSPEGNGENKAVVNFVLAKKMGLHAGDVIVVRFSPGGSLSDDFVLSKKGQEVEALRLVISDVRDEHSFGNFSLENSPLAPANIFLPLALLQKKLNWGDRVNQLLTGPVDKDNASAWIDQTLKETWDIEDMGIKIETNAEKGCLDLKTDQIFFNSVLEKYFRKTFPKAQFILSYLVNGIHSETSSTPYSMVSSVDGNSSISLARGQIRVSEWVKNDLELKKGDSIDLEYFALDRSRQLKTMRQTLTVSGFFETEGLVDRGMMPDYPGLSDAASCSDWDSGMPIDMGKIRKKDEDYWEKFKGTPKALVSFDQAREIWDNRFGILTSIRLPDSEGSAAILRDRLTSEIEPQDLGMRFIDLKALARQSTRKSMGFGPLFIGFSFFVMIASLALTVLTFSLQIRHRFKEIGILKAFGFSRWRLFKVFLIEMVALAVPAGLLGSFFGLIYCRGILWGIRTFWSAIMGEFKLEMNASLGAVFWGCLFALGLTFSIIGFSYYRVAGTPLYGMLKDRAKGHQGRPRYRWVWKACSSLFFVSGLWCAFLAKENLSKQAIFFFSSGFLLLIAGMAAYYVFLTAPRQSKLSGVSLLSRAWKFNGLYPLRSLTVAGLVSSGVFMVISVDAYRLSASQSFGDLENGMGGFELIAKSSIPVSLPEIQKEMDAGSTLIAFRQKQGDDTSCLNLNRAMEPRLFGVDPALLAGRFSFLDYGVREKDPWLNLNEVLKNGDIPVIGNLNTLLYSLEVKVGDSLPVTSENGSTFNLRIMAALDNCLFQEGLIVSENNLLKLFPSQSNYQLFLFDVPKNLVSGLKNKLSDSFSVYGLDVESTTTFLDSFNHVQNTYISIFQALGVLGLLIGTFGLTAVLFRNVVEREHEFAVYHALGISRATVKNQVFAEHFLLFLIGMAVGLACAVVGVFPQIMARGLPLQTIVVVPALLIVCAAGSLLWAISVAMKRPLIEALRRE